MQQLIQDLLTLSRVGTTGVTFGPISAENALLEALKNLKGAIDDSGAIVTANRLPEVHGDQTQLVQLFQNLIGNAIKYQEGAVPPEVHISAARGGDHHWHFCVTDNGIGIDPQYSDRIFGMFQRLHGRDQFSGTGIGLAICKKIVERHGGDISVAPRPEGGSTFTFSLEGAH
jgi:light-regulated signal transduction histidine kinase (bacteriophytochrome)